ncbi:hypothetical protein [Demequina lutea]|uniref:Homoserine acetyltransferase n=1 Tax=Demequina lutea TaxID=431489 RepID=A0A7Z0CJ02_9MICO|nr:hypothetical protein [Demequina lutea]NYI40438.1 homoserine acetyltransferase [Demequina lutea]
MTLLTEADARNYIGHLPRHEFESANIVGGCQGATGPAHPHSTDGRPWGLRFPWLTLRDMVAAEVRLTDALGIYA